MSPQSHAPQLLNALYGELITRHRRRRAPLGLAVIEPLPPRRLFSVMPLGVETLVVPTTGGVDSASITIARNTGSGGALSATATVPLEIVTEFRANTALTNTQYQPAVAMAADGGYVVAWSSNQGGGSFFGYGIYLQRYDAAGNPVGGEIHVNTTTPGDQLTPAVAIDDAGNVLVAWSSDTATDGWEIIAQGFDANGNTVSGEIAVNGTTLGQQQQPVVAAAATGQFVVAWRGDDSTRSDIFARTIGINGPSSGSEFRVNQNVTNSHDEPAIASDGNGHVVVTWRSLLPSTAAAGVFAREFDASGSPITDDFQVNVTTNGSQDHPSVSMSPKGAFVIAWTSGNAQDGSGDGVYARRFNAGGGAATGEFRVTTTTADNQHAPTVAVDGSGAFTIAWASNNQDGSGEGIFAQKYDASGNVLGGEFKVSGTTYGSQNAPAAAANLLGNLAVVWQGNGVGDDDGVFGQLYEGLAAAPINTVPTGVATNEDTTLTFSGANAISISTANTQAIRVALGATHGLITLANVSGLTFTAGDGASDATMTFRGTAAAINTALNGLHFQPDANYNGLASLKIDTTDASYGPSLTDSDTVAITITPLNDAAPQPPITPPPPVSEPLTLPPAESPAIEAAPPTSPVDVLTTDAAPAATTSSGSGTDSASSLAQTGETNSGGGGSSGSESASATPQAIAEAAPPAQVIKTPEFVKPPEAAGHEPLVQKEIAAAGQSQRVTIATPVASPETPPVAPALPAALPAAPPAAAVAFIAKPDAVMTQQLDQLHDQITNEARVLRLVAGSASFVSLGLSIVYILWTIRAGYLLAGLLSSMPAWTFVDPLPILDHFDDEMERKRRKTEEDGESLETMVKGSDEPGVKGSDEPAGVTS